MRRGRGLAAAAFILLAAVCSAPSSAKAQPREVKLGVYVTALNGINLGAGTFNADLWLWSTTASDELRPLESVDIVNASSRYSELTGTRHADSAHWYQQRVRVTARNEFHIHHFPFDSQKLHLSFEDSLLAAKDLVYIADRENSRVAGAVRIPGWTVRGWDIKVVEHRYDTSFGDPGHSGPVVASRLIFTVDIQRDGLAEFIELSLGALVAFAILALTFRMNPTLPPIFAGRMGVIVASVFTVTISLRGANAATALPIGSTLVDRIHLVTLAAGFAAAVAAATVRYMAESGRESRALAVDRRAMPIFIGAYIAIVTATLVPALVD